MKEWQAILAARGASPAALAALATVVAVQGSSYRRPGARLLLDTDGQTVGSISGGCLERDVRLRAARVIATDEAQLVTYDSGEDSDDQGAALGCGGIIQVLIAPLPAGNVPLFDGVIHCLTNRQRGAIATIIRSDSTSSFRMGESCVFVEHGPRFGSGQLADLLDGELQRLLGTGAGGSRTISVAAGNLEVFCELLPLSPALVICGSGPGVAPTIAFARILGWPVTVVSDTWTSHIQDHSLTIQSRLPEQLDERTAVLVMTHNYQRDRQLLGQLLGLPLPYLGLLGPHHRTARLLAELGTAAPAHLHAPIGLDLGAETPEQIALATVAEIQAVFTGHPAGFLRDRRLPVAVSR